MSLQPKEGPQPDKNGQRNADDRLAHWFSVGGALELGVLMVLAALARLDEPFTCKGASLPLLVPLGDPAVGADGLHAVVLIG